MPELQINYLAIGAAALTTVVIGVIWYSPILFGGQWLEAHGYSIEQMRQSAGRNLIVSLFCYVVMATVMAVLFSYLGFSTLFHGALLGFLVWLGFLATLGMTAHLVAGKPLSIYLIDAGYQLVYAIVMGTIIAAWR